MVQKHDTCSGMQTFKVGDKAVYPGQGVGEVMGIEYKEKIKTGSVFEIAEVLRDLYLLKFDKDLSFGERKMLDTARNLLIKELSLAKGVNEDDIEGDLKTIFNC